MKNIHEMFSSDRVMNQEITEDIGVAVTRISSWLKHTPIYTLFTDIPQKKNMSYITHLWRHAKQSIYFGYLAICLWIHAFFPFLCSESSESLKPPGTESVLKPVKESLDNGTAL